MKRLTGFIWPLALFAAVLLALATVAASCRFNQRRIPLIAVSIQPEKFLLEQIVGDKVEVVSLLGNESNPETYEPNMTDMITLERSQAYFTVGTIGYEYAILEKVRINNPGLHIFNMNNGITRLAWHGYGDGEADPHVWTSVRNAKIMAGNMLRALVELYPSEKRFFTKRCKTLLAHLDGLDAQFAERLKSTRASAFVVWHPSFGYFARDYNLTQLALDNGKEPSVTELKARLGQARQRGARVLVMQRQFDSRLAGAVRQGTDVRTVTVNSMSEHWEEEMAKLVNALSGQ